MRDSQHVLPLFQLGQKSWKELISWRLLKLPHIYLTLSSWDYIIFSWIIIYGRWLGVIPKYFDSQKITSCIQNIVENMYDVQKRIWLTKKKICVVNLSQQSQLIQASLKTIYPVHIWYWWHPRKCSIHPALC